MPGFVRLPPLSLSVGIVSGLAVLVRKETKFSSHSLAGICMRKLWVDGRKDFSTFSSSSPSFSQFIYLLAIYLSIHLPACLSRRADTSFTTSLMFMKLVVRCPYAALPVSVPFASPLLSCDQAKAR
ncbi:hypothetical protein F5Y14DRAFT_365391 [Nemania sp. NC0429]|nr:hypothetical protein F5Y14DRAFT_365391 [Nemania sp. NC0429]